MRMDESQLKDNCECRPGVEKIEFTQCGRQPRGVITHVKVPFYVRGQVNDLEIKPEGLAYRGEDLPQRKHSLPVAD